MHASTRSRNRKYEDAEKTLLAQKAQLTARINDRMREVHIDREPEDEAARAADSTTKDWAAASLERERRTLEEIEAALRRIKSGEYGLCTSCADPIADARLKALPWARVCLKCAEQASR